MLVTAFSPFPTVFSNLSKREIIILTTSNLPSANAFNLDQAIILSFVYKELSNLYSSKRGFGAFLPCTNAKAPSHETSSYNVLPRPDIIGKQGIVRVEHVNLDR